MALIKCPEPNCGRMVSTSASACPGCGCPIGNAGGATAQEFQHGYPETQAATVAASPNSESTPSTPAPRLVAQKIIAELLRLSQPNGRIPSTYLMLLQHSQKGYWIELADRGDVDAKFLLAVTAQDSESSTQSDRLMPLALQGHNPSMWQIGFDLAKEYSLPSYARGMEMLKRAGQSGIKSALLDYATCLECAPDDERTYDRLCQQRDQIHQSLARDGFPPAMQRVGSNMVNIQPSNLPEHRKARMIEDGMRLLMKAAEAGNYLAASDLESQYRRGWNVPMSGVEAKFWKDRERELLDQMIGCPANAYGIKSLLDAGWIAKGHATMIK